MARFAVLLTLIVLCGCGGETSSEVAPKSAAPLGRYEAKVSGSADEMLLHLDALQAQFTRVSEPSPGQARAASDAFRTAVIGTARAVLDRRDLLPQQATKATDAAMTMLQGQKNVDPADYDTLIAVADQVIANYPNTQAATNAAFAKANAIGFAPESRFKTHEERVDQLFPAVMTLGKSEPKMPEAGDMLLKLALDTEGLGRFDEAKALHQVLIDKFAGDERAQDSENRIRRMDMMNKPIGEFKGKNLDGSDVDIESFRGKVVLIDFWGSWCGPCVGALPKIKALRKEFGEAEFQILGVITDAPEIGKVFLKKENIDWPQIAEGMPPEPGSLQERFAVGYFPTYLVVDREGNLVGSSNDLNAATTTVAKLLGKAVPADAAHQHGAHDAPVRSPSDGK